MTNQNEKSTKQKFMEEALRFFAEKGYSAVSVSQIATAVGCSAPALYKHFKSKQELFDAILIESEKMFAMQMRRDRIDITDNPDAVEALINMSLEQCIEHTKDIVKSAIHNEFAQAFRKMCIVEQFHMPKLAEIYTYRYITFHLERSELVFSKMIERGVIKSGDAKALATMYMALPIMAIGMCDREPEKEDEVMDMLERHAREFYCTYINR